MDSWTWIYKYGYTCIYIMGIHIHVSILTLFGYPLMENWAWIYLVWMSMWVSMQVVMSTYGQAFSHEISRESSLELVVKSAWNFSSLNHFKYTRWVIVKHKQPPLTPPVSLLLKVHSLISKNIDFFRSCSLLLDVLSALSIACRQYFILRRIYCL